MKISFDYDFTLSEEYIQDIAKSYIDDGHDVYITTSRFNWGLNDEWKNKDLYLISKKLNIGRDKIRFTHGGDKYPYLEDFDIHYDDDIIDIELIRENVKCRSFIVSEDEDFNISIMEII